MRFVGLPYIWGGDDPVRGFDCSGLVQEVLSAFGAHPSPGTDLTAQGLYNALIKGGEYKSSAVGALAFYGKDYSHITHVAMIMYSGIIIEAGGGGSATKTPDDAVVQNAYIRLRPLHRRKDFIVSISPKYP